MVAKSINKANCSCLVQKMQPKLTAAIGYKIKAAAVFRCKYALKVLGGAIKWSHSKESKLGELA